MLEIIRKENRWKTFYIGMDGKKRLASDIVIPPDLTEEELIDYLDDLCHEWATPDNKEIKVMDL